MDSQNALGELLIQLDPPDMAGARHWWTAAAEGGKTGAQTRLGKLLAGYLEPPDLTGARRWLTAAAEAGDTDAQSNLGLLLTQLDPPDLTGACAGGRARGGDTMRVHWALLAAIWSRQTSPGPAAGGPPPPRPATPLPSPTWATCSPSWTRPTSPGPVGGGPPPPRPATPMPNSTSACCSPSWTRPTLPGPAAGGPRPLRRAIQRRLLTLSGCRLPEGRASAVRNLSV